MSALTRNGKKNAIIILPPLVGRRYGGTLEKKRFCRAVSQIRAEEENGEVGSLARHLFLPDWQYRPRSRETVY